MYLIYNFYIFIYIIKKFINIHEFQFNLNRKEFQKVLINEDYIMKMMKR